MNNDELRKLEQKVSQANKLLETKEKLEKLIKSIDETKVIKSIDCEIFGIRGSFMNLDPDTEDDIVRKTVEITANDLGVTDSYFSQSLYEPIKVTLEKMLDDVNKEFEKL